MDCSKDACRECHSPYFFEAASLRLLFNSFNWFISCYRVWIWWLEALTCLLRFLHCWYNFSPSSSTIYNLPLPSSIVRVIAFFSSKQCRWLSSASFSIAFRWVMTCPSLQSAQWDVYCLPAALNLLTSSFKLPIWWVRFYTYSFNFHSLNEKNSYCLANFNSYCFVNDSILNCCSSFRNCIWYSLSGSASEPRIDFL